MQDVQGKTPVQKLQYDPTVVRPAFRRKFCHEMTLPSGKHSGYELYPITEEEVRTLTSDYTAPTFVETDNVMVLFGGYFKNESEWRLWTALRVKYGTNYMKPKREQFWLPDYKYEPRKEPDPAETLRSDLENQLEQRAEFIEEKIVKNVKEHLTSVKVIL